MHKLEELRDMLMAEIEKCTDKGISAGSLDVIDKLTHAVKSIDTIMAMEEAGYSNDGYSYARGRRGNVRRDSMGRYSSRYDDGNYRSNNSYRYSRDDAKHDLADELREMAMNTDDPESKNMIHKWLKQVEE